jgi:type IV secretory pathway TrbL component
MNNTSVIDTFLSVFTSYIDSGFGLWAARWASCPRR